VPLRHDELLIYGVADTIEESADGTLMPVEHKSGRSTRAPMPAMLQVVAQALCLASMTGMAVPSAGLYFAKDNQRLDVDVEAYTIPVERCIVDLRRNLQSHGLPPWTEQRQRCRACSLHATCMPELGSAEAA
jgi:CRISPR-associated exonuclease Cas4